jgi:signal transduction histidine kinase
MNKNSLLKTLSICLAFALFISMFSLFILGKIAEDSANNARKNFLSFIAKRVEESGKNIEEIDLHDIRPLRPGPGGPRKAPRFDEKRPKRMGLPPRGPETTFWLVDESGKVLSSTGDKLIPRAWDKLKKPTEPQAVAVWTDFFLIKPSILIIKLDTTPTSYLMGSDDRTFFHRPLLLTQIGLTLLTVSSSLVLALVLISLYLKKKSLEAQAVIKQLGQGDLKARFPSDQIDDKSGLVDSFNKMASEIERLVTRLKETEIARSNLMQELGHDLRTPLTSLNSASQILREHYKAMPDEQREKLFSMIQSDINYFKDLIEKLIIIASLDGHSHKRPEHPISLPMIFAEEIEARNNLQSKIAFSFENVLSEEESFIHADPLHISRLIKNGLDNASRYASSKVQLKLNKNENRYIIEIIDDGVSLSESSIALFGKRREKREKSLHNDSYSLGLGSVIMKTICDIYDGELSIERVMKGQEVVGAKLTIKL